MLKVTATIEGKSESDIVSALHQIIKGVELGCAFGSDANDDGEYTFEMTGERDQVPAGWEG